MRRHEQASGPLVLDEVLGNGASSEAYISVAPGSLVVRGILTPTLSGDNKAAVLRTVEVSTDARSFTRADGAFVTKSEEGAPGIGPWPDPEMAPPGSYDDVANYQLSPGDYRRLMVVFTAPEKGSVTWKAIALSYTVDGERFVSINSSLHTRICVPRNAECR